MKLRTIAISGAVVLAVMTAAYLFDVLGESPVLESSTPSKKQAASAQEVKTALVSDLSTNKEPLELFGQIVSVSGVSVAPEVGGVVSRVYRRIGDRVNAGQVVLELQNAVQAQAVAQARAGLDSAKASLQSVQDGAGAETIAGAQSAIATQESALAQVVQGTLSQLDAAYITLESQLALLDRMFFTNTGGVSPQVSVSFFTEAQNLSLQKQRVEVKTSLERSRQYSDVDVAIKEYQSQIKVVKNMSQSLSQAVKTLQAGGALSQATIDNWGTEIQSVSTQLDALVVRSRAMDAGLQERRQAIVAAKTSLRELESGADSTDIAVAQATVSNAEAALASAVLALNKTKVTAPIRGRIASLDAKVGSLVGASPVFEISNNNTLRVDAYVTDTQAALIRAGDSAVIDDTHPATVSVVAPTVSSNSGKVKIELLFDNPDTRMVEGTGVGVEIQYADSQSTQEPTVISIPISAVFVRGEQVFVYVVQDNKAVVTAIETRELFGDKVTVVSGLEARDEIVLFARSIEDGALIKAVNK